nr:MAG TPA: hypothetical protein [Caudoviricetes sp.]
MPFYHSFSLVNCVFLYNILYYIYSLMYTEMKRFNRLFIFPRSEKI